MLLRLSGHLLLLLLMVVMVLVLVVEVGGRCKVTILRVPLSVMVVMVVVRSVMDGGRVVGVGHEGSASEAQVGRFRFELVLVLLVLLVLLLEGLVVRVLGVVRMVNSLLQVVMVDWRGHVRDRVAVVQGERPVDVVVVVLEVVVVVAEEVDVDGPVAAILESFCERVELDLELGDLLS